MRTVGLRFSSYRWQRPRPIHNGLFTYSEACIGLVEIDTDEGITGYGLTTDPLIGNGNLIISETIRTLAPVILGKDPLRHELIWGDLWRPKLIGRRGLTTRAISAVDIALWDIKAKAAGLPLHVLLGGYRERIPGYVAGGYYEEGKGIEELQEEVSGYVKLGAGAIKMKIGGMRIREDTERVAAVRDAVGPDIDILLDANGAYTVFDAVKVARALEPLDIFWFEEPIHPEDYDGLARVAGSTTIPIAAGENEYTKHGFRDLIERGGVSILNADAQILGGITEFMKVAAIAQAHNIPIAPHGHPHIHTPLVAAIPNGLVIEYYPSSVVPGATAMLRRTVGFGSDGHVRPMNDVGLGIDIDPDVPRDLHFDMRLPA